jgi:hypothetical protein
MKMSKTEKGLIEELISKVSYNEMNLLKIQRDSKRRFNAAEKLVEKFKVSLHRYSPDSSFIEISLYSTTVDLILEETKAESMKLRAKYYVDKVFVNPHYDDQISWGEMIASALQNAKDTEGADVLGSTIRQIKYWSSFRSTLEMILDESEEALIDVKAVLSEGESEAAERVEVELTFEPRHWNRNAACFIPESWVAWILEPGAETRQKWPCGKTEAEAKEAVKREFTNPVFI